MQPLSLLFGSEGNLGVITKALIAIHPKPEECRYGSLVFRSFADGVAFLKAVRADGALPASIRLVNNREFRLRPGAAAGGARRCKRGRARCSASGSFGVLGFDPDDAGGVHDRDGGHASAKWREQERALRRLAKRFRAVWGGAENGRRGYSLTFAIAYLRDFFEPVRHRSPNRSRPRCPGIGSRTCAPPSSARSRPSAPREACAGTPYLSYRVTQTYHAGVCVYFTMALSGRGLADPGRSSTTSSRRCGR